MRSVLLPATLGLILNSGLNAEDLQVNITPDMARFKGVIEGAEVVIQRNQNQQNTINPIYAKTSRPCPPFCIQPIKVADGVETIGELEVMDYLRKMANGDDSLMLIDSRTPSWLKGGSIPGAVNIPWTRLDPAKGVTTKQIIDLMREQFSVVLKEGKTHFDVDEGTLAGTAAEAFDYSNAKTVILFCNGMWCGQSPRNIRTLLEFGYPAERIKWYRGGMQDWEAVGLTTTKQPQK